MPSGRIAFMSCPKHTGRSVMPNRNSEANDIPLTTNKSAPGGTSVVPLRSPRSVTVRSESIRHRFFVRPDENHGDLNWSFFRDSANSLAEIVPEDADLEAYLRVIDIPAVTNGRLLHLFMDSEREKAVAFLGEEIV